jgi:hypothetical protein
VIRTLPSGVYRVRGPGKYLFTFDSLVDGTDREARVVDVRLPGGPLHDGDEIIMANLSAPIHGISLSVHVSVRGGESQPGFPLQLSGYQQQTFWWIRGTGWAYAGGFGSVPAFGAAASAPAGVVYFGPTPTDPISLLNVKPNALTLQPLFNARVLAIIGDNVNIIGTIEFIGFTSTSSTSGTSTFTSIGPGDVGPNDTGVYGYFGCTCGPTNNELTMISDGVSPIQGTVTAHVQVDNNWIDAGPLTEITSPPLPISATPNMTTLIFTGCTLTPGRGATISTDKYLNRLTLELSAYPTGGGGGEGVSPPDGTGTYQPFTISNTPYSWFWANYSSNSAATTALFIYNWTGPSISGQITDIQTIINGTTYSAHLYYSSDCSGAPYPGAPYASCAYNGQSQAIDTDCVPGNEGEYGVTCHWVGWSGGPAFFIVAGLNYIASGGRGDFYGYVTFSNMFPMPLNPSPSTLTINNRGVTTLVDASVCWYPVNDGYPQIIITIGTPPT